jgi:hypothetical protein
MSASATIIQEFPLDRPRLQVVTDEPESRLLLESTERLIEHAAPIVARERREWLWPDTSGVWRSMMLAPGDQNGLAICRALVAGEAVPVDQLNQEWFVRFGGRRRR